MSVELNIVGTVCGADRGGLSCSYCYQGRVRADRPRELPVLDREAIVRAVRRSGANRVSTFGGEPLLARREDLEWWLRFSFEEFGASGVQTAGHAITPWHWDLFRRYKTRVNFSIDGPEELNDARSAGSIEATRAATRRSIGSLFYALREGIPTGLIVTLHRLNASAERLPRLVYWLRTLDAAGLGNSVRLHILEKDGAGEKLALSPDDTARAFLALYDVEPEFRTLTFDVFRDITAKLLNPFATTTCIWNWCDPLTTTAVQGIEPDGTRALCHRVNKAGRSLTPAPGGPVPIRQAILATTPQSEGGCAGCRFFLVCAGNCPGTAIDGDWRKRTSDCSTWYAIMKAVEERLVARGLNPFTTGEPPVFNVPDFFAKLRAASSKKRRGARDGKPESVATRSAVR